MRSDLEIENTNQVKGLERKGDSVQLIVIDMI